MRLYLLSVLFLLLCCQAFGQSCATPLVVDFSQKADTSAVIGGYTRNGDCCTGNNCISFAITVNPSTQLINFKADQITGASFYTVNCGTPIPIGTPACITGLTNIQISFCKPGNNVVNYTISASSGIHTSSNLTLRTGCTGTMSVTGLLNATTTWTSIYPGATGAYDSYLNQTTGSSVTVTPQTGAPAYIDYQVSGLINANCPSAASATIRVYVNPALTVSISPATSSICAGQTVTLTANPVGGDPAYTYSWSTGETTQSITVSTPGTYSVSVNDQTSCGAVTQQVTVTSYSLTPPTAPGVSICAGNAATLTATAPGGTYQWYSVATNGTLLFSGSSYTTPVLTANTTYYVQTTNGTCTSARTPVTVTVNPAPAKPAINP